MLLHLRLVLLFCVCLFCLRTPVSISAQSPAQSDPQSGPQSTLSAQSPSLSPQPVVLNPSSATLNQPGAPISSPVSNPPILLAPGNAGPPTTTSTSPLYNFPTYKDYFGGTYSQDWTSYGRQPIHIENQAGIR